MRPVSANLETVEAFRELPQEELAGIARSLKMTSIARGQALVRQGDAAQALFIVVSGRFKVLREGRERPIAEIGSGQPIGEIAFFAGGERTATVVAERDSLVLELSRTDFDSLAARHPRMWQTITAQLARRLGAVTTAPVAGAKAPMPRTITICRAGGATGQTGQTAGFAAALRAAFAKSLRVRMIDGAEAITASGKGTALGSGEATLWFNTLEASFDHVVYIADDELTDWSKKAIRQADLVLCVGRAYAGCSPEPNLLERFAAQLHGSGILRLVLQQAGPAPYTGTARWLDARPWVEMHHHVDCSSEEAERRGLERLVRFARGEALGLVACGGGALCAAHIGVFDALAERGIEPDILGGASGGAAMTAALARGIAADEIERRTEDIFITRKAMRRWTVPRYSLLDHANFDRALSDHFTSINIEDLGVPFFAVATNLSRNAVQCIRRGPLWLAVRASAAIPAILPPVYTADGEMLVDGCVMANTPIETALALKSGPNIVIDFDLPEPTRMHIDTSALPSRGHMIASILCGSSRRLPEAPGPHAVLMRSLMLNRPNYARDLGAADILLRPPIPGDVGHLDWHRHSHLRALARDYARGELERLGAQGHPVLAPRRLPREDDDNHSGTLPDCSEGRA